MQRLKSHFVGERETLRSGRFYYRTKLHYYRNIRTHQERAMYELHRQEYRHVRQLKLRVRRGNSLSTAWYDIRTSAFDYTKSWKHNSKRRHQWYRSQDVKIHKNKPNIREKANFNV